MSLRRRVMGQDAADDIGIPFGVNFYEQVRTKEGWYDQRANNVGNTFSCLWDRARTSGRTVTALMPYDTRAQFRAVGLENVGNVMAVLAFDENEICIAAADYTDIASVQSAILSAEQTSGKKCKYVACTFNHSSPVWMRIA